MKRFGYIGRDDESKGLNNLIDVMTKIGKKYDTELYIFGSEHKPNSEKIISMGWTPKEKIWSTNFDYLVLPMIAPETFSLVLHEAESFNKKVIINEQNISLTSQVNDGAIYFNDNDSERTLEMVITYLLSQSQESEKKLKLIKKKNLWDRLEKKY